MVEQKKNMVEQEEEFVDSDDPWEPIENRGDAEWCEAMENKMKLQGSARRFCLYAMNKC